MEDIIRTLIDAERTNSILFWSVTALTSFWAIYLIISVFIQQSRKKKIPFEISGATQQKVPGGLNQYSKKQPKNKPTPIPTNPDEKDIGSTESDIKKNTHNQKLNNPSDTKITPFTEKAKSNTEKEEELPAVTEEKSDKPEIRKYVKYDISMQESNESYPVFRYPNKGCIVRTHRSGSTKRRGYKEESFQESIQKIFGLTYVVSGDVRLNTGKDTRPYEPDIAIIGANSGNDFRIDIEIDEPYAGITRQPSHCKGEDTLRDTYFIDRGWIVIRFSEYQVHIHEAECLKYIAQIVKLIDPNYTIPGELIKASDPESEKLWDTVQAQKWEREKYRENYLDHEFQKITEEEETTERGLNKHEQAEEKEVQATSIVDKEESKATGYNSQNAHERDERISFYPEPHEYKIDGVPATSASSIITRFFPVFDSYGTASRLSPSNPLYGLSVDEIVQTWKRRGQEAADKGTFLHEQIEKYYLGQPFTRSDEFHLFDKFVEDHKDIHPYRSEWRIFDEHFQIAGTIDLIAQNRTGYTIYDWKRSKKIVNPIDGKPIIYDRWGKTGIGKLSAIDDTSFNKYSLQQSLYRYILETNYNLNISKSYLVVLHPENSNYYKLEVPYLKDEISYILETL